MRSFFLYQEYLLLHRVTMDFSIRSFKKKKNKERTWHLLAKLHMSFEDSLKVCARVGKCVCLVSVDGHVGVGSCVFFLQFSFCCLFECLFQFDSQYEDEGQPYQSVRVQPGTPICKTAKYGIRVGVFITKTYRAVIQWHVIIIIWLNYKACHFSPIYSFNERGRRSMTGIG